MSITRLERVRCMICYSMKNGGAVATYNNWGTEFAIEICDRCLVEMSAGDSPERQSQAINQSKSNTKGE